MPGLSTTHCGVLRLVKITIKMKIKMEMEIFYLPIFDLQATLYEGGVRSPGFIHAPNILPR